MPDRPSPYIMRADTAQEAVIRAQHDIENAFRTDTLRPLTVSRVACAYAELKHAATERARERGLVVVEVQNKERIVLVSWPVPISERAQQCQTQKK